MNMPCPNAINCPGTDNPVANFSSEVPDQTIYLHIGYGFDDPPGTNFPPSPNCVTFTQSVISQSDAETCATVSQRECVNGLPVAETSTACTVTPSNPNSPVFPFIPPHPQPNIPSIQPFSGFSCADQDYTHLLLVSGLNLPITLAVTAGALPPGITLGPTGLLSGSPTTAGFYSFTITATDSVGNHSSTDMTFTVLGILTDSVLPDGTSGVAYSKQLVGGGGADQFAITAGSLQTGLTMDEFGLISGTPSSSGGTTFTVTVTDAFLNTCDKDFVIKVNGAALCMTPITLPDCNYGNPTYYGILTPIVPIVSVDAVWTVVAGALPAGLWLDGSANYTGGIVALDPVFGGASECGTFHFTVRVTASDPPTDCTQDITLTVIQPIGWTGCGGTPTTAPAGGPWVWPGGGTPPGGTAFYSFTICNDTCVTKILNWHFTAANPWSGVPSEMDYDVILNGFGGGFSPLWFSPTGIPNIQDLVGSIVVNAFSTNTVDFKFQVQLGPVDANSGNLTFSF